MRKRLLGMALLLAAVVAVLCLNTEKAQAASSHTHPVCGSTCRCSGDTHYSANWQPWDGTTKMYNGYYYLTKDVVLSSTMILDYSYSSNLCLNGHSIYCEDTVFNIYTYRSITITDCVGTGEIDSAVSGFGTISNNGYLRVWGGTVLNSGPLYGQNAIVAWSGSSTYISGGRVESTSSAAIYLDVGSKVFMQGGVVHGKYGATEAVGGTGTQSQLTVSGGSMTTDYDYGSALDIGSGTLRITGGYVEGVSTWAEGGTTIITGGTIAGRTNLDSNSVTINAGTFQGLWYIDGTDITISGGDFTGSEVVIQGQTWICGGSFDTVRVENVPLYLSGVSDIRQLEVENPGKISAQSLDGTGSFGGDTVDVLLSPEVTTWKDGDIVIKNVKSDAVAKKFRIVGTDSEWMFLERINNNLVLRIIPHGTWGDATWSVVDGTLTISGTGALKYTYSGNQYPWGGYHSQIREIVVEPGITEIPYYAFEYCSKATKISLPETLTHLTLNAFNDCSSLNNLMLPASLTKISGTSNTGCPAFIRCGALTDVYYRGTAEQWASVENASRVESHDSEMTLHFLQLQETTATCTQPGTAPHYRFYDTSVYADIYDINMQPISQPEQLPALGHRLESGEDPETAMPDCTTAVVCDYCGLEIKAALGHAIVYHEGKTPDVGQVGWEAYETCDRCDYTTYVELPALVLTPNINCDDKVDNADVLLLLWHTLFAEANPVTVDCDLNRDGFVDNADVLLLLWHTLFPEENPI